MILTRLVLLHWLVLLLIGFSVGCGEKTAQPLPTKEMITIGLNPSERSENTQKNADLLAELISGHVGMPVKMFVAQDYSGLVEALHARTVDFAFLAPISYVYAERIADARVLLKAERNGTPYYFGCIVVRTDSPYRTIEDLRGKQIAWVDPSSSSGHIFPKAALIERGIDPDDFFSRQTFAGGHDAVLLSVINGRIEAGATFANDTIGRSGSWTQLEEGKLAGQIRPLFFSQPIPADNLSTSQYMIDNYPELVRKVTDAVAGMNRDTAAAAVLKSMYHVDAMVPATSADYDPVRRAADLLNLDITGKIKNDQGKNTLYSWLLVCGALLFGIAVLVFRTLQGKKQRNVPGLLPSDSKQTNGEERDGTTALYSLPNGQFSLREIVVDYKDRKGNSVRALDGATIDVLPGEFIAVVGPSGAGKSTLLRVMNRGVEPSGGYVFFKGEDVTHVAGDRLLELRRRIGFIFQQFNLVPSISVLRNVLIGRLPAVPTGRSVIGLFPKEEIARAERHLLEVGLAEKKESRASDLSGGQQQRVAIARALAQQPEAILADEPTASLDPVLADSILTLLGRINRERGITIIANLHSIELAKEYAARIIGLRAGKVVFDGTPQELTPERVAWIYREEEEL